jgi:hypothetical protein
MAMTLDSRSVAPGWLRDRSFDLTFIVGIAALAILSGVAVILTPQLFVPILLADLWFLGYHHVIATYTRLCFDKESFRNHTFLLFGLPVLVLAAVLSIGMGIGLWVLTSIYLYWQWFHYTRQSWGVSQVYRRKANGLADDPEWSSKLIFYAVPVWGILHRSYQDPGTFIGIELRVIPVPEIAVHLAAAVAIASFAWWLVRRFMAWRDGRLPLAHTLYMLTHFAIFSIAYVWIENITYGWLVINIWHNAQYVIFVWLFNTNRFKSGIDPKARFLSKISQPDKTWTYFGICFGLSTAVYLALDNTLVLLIPAIIIYQSINFHHYIVDSVIWKVRKKPLQKTLGLAG